MSLKNHFLVEDYPMMLDEIDKLHHTFINILHSVENADFSTKENQLENMRYSLSTLKSLNVKKLERERSGIE